MWDNKKEMDRERASSAKETLIDKLKVKNLNLNVTECFNNMKNFRKEKISFGKVIIYISYLFKSGNKFE